MVTLYQYEQKMFFAYKILCNDANFCGIVQYHGDTCQPVKCKITIIAEDMKAEYQF